MPATYADATLRRCITTIRNADENRIQRIARQMDRENARATAKPVAKPAPVRKPAAKPASASVRKATVGQRERINRAEIALGYRVSPASVLGTINDAKAIWAGLKQDASKVGIRLDCR